MQTESKTRITEKSIGGTVYVVESLESPDAKETACTKVKRLILSNSSDPKKLSEMTQLHCEMHSTCA